MAGSWSTGDANPSCEVCPKGKYLDGAKDAALCPELDVASCDGGKDLSGSCSYCEAGYGTGTAEDGIARGEKANPAVKCIPCGGVNVAITAWHPPGMTGADQTCKMCPQYNFLPMEDQIFYDLNKCNKTHPDGNGDSNSCEMDLMDKCTSDCLLIKGPGYVLSDMYASCLVYPAHITPKDPTIAKGGFTSACDGGHAADPVTGDCTICEPNTYALPGHTECVPCAAGYEAPARGMMGCTMITPLPTCSAGEVAVPPPANYDCLLDTLTTGHRTQGFGGGSGCNAMMTLLSNAFAAGQIDENTFMSFVGGFTRFCPMALAALADFPTLAKGVQDQVRNLAGEAVAKWGLDDDHAVKFVFALSGLFPVQKNQIGPVVSGCVTMDDIIASGKGFNHPANVLAEKNAKGEQCSPTACSDDRLTKDWCTHPLIHAACPVTCGGVPPPTLTCGEVGTFVQSAGVTLGLSWEFWKPVQPPSMAKCGAEWTLNSDTGLIEPYCGKPENMKWCKDSNFVVPKDADDVWHPECTVEPMPEDSACTPGPSSCDHGLTCVCESHSRRALKSLKSKASSSWRERVARRTRSLLFASSPQPMCKCVKEM
jgi:hypothetical protein